MEFHLSKVRFRSENYPDNNFQASRYVLLVDEFEIRDRVQYSNFNKFLYLYTTQERPKPSNGNMVCSNQVEKNCLIIFMFFPFNR